MADQYPKRRHRLPAPAAEPAAVAFAEPLTEAEESYIAQQRALFIELFGEPGLAFIRDLYNVGYFPGWRGLLAIRALPDDPPLPMAADEITDASWASEPGR